MRVEAVETVLRALGSYNPSPKINSAGSWGAASCPLAPWRHKGRDEHPSLMVSVEPGKSSCKCMGCGFTGGLRALVLEVRDLGGIEVEIAKELSYMIVMEESRHWKQLEVDPPDIPETLVSELDQWHPYWGEREIGHREVRLWRLGYSAHHQRVLMPFFDFQGNLRGVVGRDITGMRGDKYRVFPTGFDRAKYLFGEQLLSGEERQLLVVEGYLDAISSRRYLPPEMGVVALGTAVPSDEQVRRIRMFAGDEVISGLDQDGTGLIGTSKLLRMLRGAVPVTQVNYGSTKDANEAGEKIVDIVAGRTGGLFDDVLSRLNTLARA